MYNYQKILDLSRRSRCCLLSLVARKSAIYKGKVLYSKIVAGMNFTLNFARSKVKVTVK